MKKLELWNEYSREAVHGIFSPTTVFTPQAGTWGLHGIVRIPDRVGDWVFLVTFGSEQGGHVFDESITEDGVLSWQSQPAQKMKDPKIQELIRHDYQVNNIHLFLRTRDGAPYCYLGALGYITHDTLREAPVHFQWQLLNWPTPPGLFDRIGLKMLPTMAKTPVESFLGSLEPLTIVDTPSKKSQREGVPTEQFKKRKAPDYALRDERNRQLGLKGELIVLSYERKRLQQAGCDDLAEKIVHISVEEGDVAGYDIRSFEEDGSTRHIEVKTTEGGASTNFFISPNELAFSAQNSQTYFLYRLFEFNPIQNSSKTFILKGDVKDSLTLKATAFRATLNGE